MITGLSRRSLGLLLFTLALLTLGGGLVLTGTQQPVREASGLRFDAQGHRGARGRFPENTLPAMQYALTAGVTTLELDVVLSADGVPVVHHDPRLDPARTRTPGGAWIDPPGPAIRRLTVEDLQSYDVGCAKPGSRVAARFPEQARLDGVRVPTLAQVIALAERRSGGEIRYNLETKVTPQDGPAEPDPEALTEALLQVVRDAGVVGRTMVQSFDWRTLAYVRVQAPEVARAYLTAEREWLDTVQRGEPGASPWLAGIDVDAYGASIPRAIAAAETPDGENYEAKAPWQVVWSPYFRDLRPAALQRAHGLGLKVVVWTPNEAATMRRLIADGVDGIISDYPRRLRAAMRAADLALPPAYPAE